MIGQSATTRAPDRRTGRRAPGALAPGGSAGSGLPAGRPPRSTGACPAPDVCLDAMSAVRSANTASALRRIQRQLSRLSGEVASLLEEMANPTAAATGAPAVRRTDAIVALLQRTGRPMSPAQIWAALREEGVPDEKDLVRVTTYQLWRKGRIVRMGPGQYSHPEHVELRPPDDDRSPEGAEPLQDHWAVGEAG